MSESWLVEIILRVICHSWTRMINFQQLTSMLADRCIFHFAQACTFVCEQQTTIATRCMEEDFVVSI